MQFQKHYFSLCVKHTGLYIGIASLLISVPIVADTKLQAAQIEEVVITASKRDQSIKDFSGSISVVKMDSLNPLATLSDVANQVPGFSLLDSGPRNPTALVMRGLRFDAMDGFENGNDGGTVASYVDNIPLQGFYVPPQFSIKDLQQIEILRGPQGTLYGNASVGGLIRYITAKPDLTQNSVNINAVISQTAEASGFNTDTDLIVNAPIVENSLGVRLLFGKQKNQGFIDNPYLISGAEKNINNDETNQFRASLLWQPSAEFSLSSSYHYQKIYVDDRQATNEMFTGNDYTASSKYLQPMTGELKLASIDADYQFNFAKLTISLSHYDYKTKASSDQTDYLITLDNTYGWGYYTSYDKFSAYTESKFDVIKDSIELRFVSSDDQPLRWLMGAFFSDDDVDVVITDTVPGFGDFASEDRPLNLDYYATQVETLREQSLYGEISYDIKPQWEMSVGARGFHYKDDATVCSLIFPTSKSFTDDNYPVDCLSGNDAHTGSLGKLSTKYKLNADQAFYLTVAEGFRRGGTNFLPVEITRNRSYKPDASINYELGSHSDFFDDTVRLSAAVFYIDWKDIQVSSVVDGYRAWLNAEDARSQGFEIDAQMKINAEWSTHIGYSFTDAQLTKSVTSINGGSENAYAGDTLPGSPRNQWNLGVDYARALNTATLKTGLTYSYLSDIYTALNDDFVDYARIKAYSMLNAKASVILRNWRLGIFVNNLTNTRGITGKRTAQLFGEAGQFEYITRPRTVGAMLNYEF